jgi:hypothetical protein
MNPTSQNAAVTTARLIKPIYFDGLSDCLATDAMIRCQKIGSPILGNIVEESASADERPPIVVEDDSSNGILFGIAEA